MYYGGTTSNTFSSLKDMRLFDFGLVKELKAKDLVEPPDGYAATGLTGSRRYSKYRIGST